MTVPPQLQELLDQCDTDLRVARRQGCRDEVDELLDFRLMIMEAVPDSDPSVG